MPTDLTRWIRVVRRLPAPKQEKPPVRHAYIFLQSVPRIMTPVGERGPFHEGDLVDRPVLPDEVWRVLSRRGVVFPVKMEV